MSEFVSPQQPPKSARLIVVSVEKDRAAADAAIGPGCPAAKADRVAQPAEVAIAPHDDLSRARDLRSLADRNRLAMNRRELRIGIARELAQRACQVCFQGVGFCVGQL